MGLSFEVPFLELLQGFQEGLSLCLRKEKPNVQCRCSPQGMGHSRNVLDFSEEEEKNKTVLVTFCTTKNRPLISVPVWTNFTRGVFLYTLVRASHA